jgi:glycosyltransferase involved in cell wall biosynthesis
MIVLKVCIVYLSGISTVRGGGISTKIKSIVKESCDEIDYSIITGIEEADVDDIRFFEDLGVNIEAIKLTHNKMLDCSRAVRQVLKTKYDIAHFHELTICWLFPLIIKLHKTSLVYEHQTVVAGGADLRFTIYFKALFPFWDKVLVNTKYMLAKILPLVRHNSQKIKLVPVGVNFEEITNSVPLSLDGISFLFFGHLSRIKGVDILVKAFHRVSQRNQEAHLHLVGDGELIGFCENFVLEKNLTDKVHFWGALPQNKLFRIVRGADICVFPSRDDAAPLALLEAMAAGKPIISTLVGGIPELVKNGRNALLIKPNVDQLACTMQYLLDNADIMEKISKYNVRDATRYSWKEASKKYVRIYRALTRQ